MVGITLLVAIGAFILLSVYTLIKGIVKREGRYRFKRVVNDLRPIVTIIASMYCLIAFLYLLIPLEEVVNGRVTEIADPKSAIIVSLTPFVVTLVVFALFWWAIVVSFKPWLTFTKEEDAKRQVEKQESKDRLHRWFPILKRFIKEA